MPVVPKVGVVITNFNNRAYVGTAIESAANQSIRDISVVVVDDASTDGSDEVIRDALSRLADPRFHYVRVEQNLGQAGAIRRGLAEIDTPFVCFLDSDDYWYPEFLAQHLVAHMNAEYPVALSFCDSHIVDGNGNILAGTAWWFDSNTVKPAHRVIDPGTIPDINAEAGEVTYPEKRRMVLRGQWSLNSATNSMAGMMFRRSFIDLVLVPPDNKIPLYVDYYLSVFAGLLTGTIAIYDALYAYRMHGENLHSNGRVMGGPYSTSTRNWQVVRHGILLLVQEIMQNKAQSIREAFGDQHAVAEGLLIMALKPPSPVEQVRGWLRNLLPWR
jgi:glycosyltransferase involved in cell wall biosynthesis